MSLAIFAAVIGFQCCALAIIALVNEKSLLYFLLFFLGGVILGVGVPILGSLP